MKISQWEHKNFCSYCKNKSLYVNLITVTVYNSSWIIFLSISRTVAFPFWSWHFHWNSYIYAVLCVRVSWLYYKNCIRNLLIGNSILDLKTILNWNKCNWILQGCSQMLWLDGQVQHTTVTFLERQPQGIILKEQVWQMVCYLGIVAMPALHFLWHPTSTPKHGKRKILTRLTK